MKKYLKNFSVLIALLTLCCVDCYAKSTGMPYESVLENLSDSLTGPVAKAVALIGIVGSGAALIFGGEISGFLKTVIYLVLCVSLLITGNILVNKFGSSGQEIAYTMDYLTHTIKIS